LGEAIEDFASDSDLGPLVGKFSVFDAAAKRLGDFAFGGRASEIRR
jgi:hypothetical protein